MSDHPSGGMLHRADLCRALVHGPQVVTPGESSGALDQFTREALWDVPQAPWMEARPTVFLATHDLRVAAILALAS